MTDVTDEYILRLILSPATRDRGFTLLMDTFKERIYWHIRRLVVTHEDAEDVLQETFINVYRYAGSFKSDCKLFTWLYRIATNECIRLLKQQEKRKSKTEGFNEKLHREISVYQPINGNEILVKFQQAILRLPQKQRIIFNLRYYDELEYEEISKILDTAVGSLKTGYHYAAEKIKDYMINY